MKKTFFIFMLALSSTFSFAQIYNFGQSISWADMTESSEIDQYRNAALEEINRFDFSGLWLNENYPIIGIIGKDYQRLDIKYLTITKDAKNRTFIM